MQAVSELFSDSSKMAGAYEADPLLSGFGLPELKVMLDIALENQRPEGFTACELGVGSGAFTKQVCISPSLGPAC